MAMRRIPETATPCQKPRTSVNTLPVEAIGGASRRSRASSAESTIMPTAATRRLAPRKTHSARSTLSRCRMRKYPTVTTVENRISSTAIATMRRSPRKTALLMARRLPLAMAR